MIKKMGRAACMAAAAACLAACGGGGGGSDNTSTPPPTNTGSALKVTFSPQSISAAANPSLGALHAATAVSITGATTEMYVGIGGSLHGVAIATVSGDYLDALQIDVTFREAGTLPNGTYADTLTFEVCVDSACAQQITGSPFSIPVTYTVSGSTATAVPGTIAAPAGFLAHDVVDAAMSQALDAVVMASSQPANALVIHDLVSGSERAIALPGIPLALALSPDGRTAAVSMGSAVSLVDLAATQPAPATVSTPWWVAGLLLADGNAVEVVPGSGWTSVLTLDMASGLAAGGTDNPILGRTVLRETDGDDRVYTLNSGTSQPHLDRWAPAAGILQHSGRSADAEQRPTCGNFWLSEAGDRLYTACGGVFSANQDPALDMQYAGQLPLTVQTATVAPAIAWLDDSSATHRIALLDAGQCGADSIVDCATLLRLVDDRDGSAVAAYFTPPAYRDGEYRVPHGQFVFHAADGSLRVLGHLAGVVDATHAYYLDKPAANGASIMAASRHALRGRRTQ